MGFVWSSAPGWTVANIAITIIQGLLPLAALYVVKLVMDAVAAGVASSDAQAAFDDLVPLLVIAASVALATAILNALGSLVSEAHSRTVADHMHDVVHRHSLAMDLGYYENPKYHDTLHRAQAEAPFRPTKIVGGLASAGQTLVSIIAMAGLLAALHWGLTLVILLAAVPPILVRIKFSRHIFGWQRQRTPDEREAAYLSRICTRPDHAKEVRLFDVGAHFAKRFVAIRTRLRNERFSLAVRRTGATAIAHVIATSAIYGAFVFIAWRAINGAITLGDLVMFSQAIQRGQGAVTGFFGATASLYEDGLFLTNLYDLLDLEPRVRVPAEPAAVPDTPTQGIKIENVHFRYPTAATDALRGIDLEIGAGEHVALVGLNGAGKSTLVKLLCRLHDPTQGRITLDGTDYRSFDPVALRRLFAGIFQDFSRFDLSARENIALGTDGAPGASVELAARMSGADALIQRLPKGYDTILGNWFPEGHQLSIGEWQKIALARGFFRQSKVVLLDEPSSALDPRSEAELFTRLDDLVKERTAVIVSHRLATVKSAHKIAFMEAGRITEIGSHEALMEARGSYARLFSAQASRYGHPTQ